MISNSSNNMNIKAYEQKLFEHFFTYSNTKTAQNPKGYLVHENSLEKAGSAVGDFGKDIVKLTKALKDGESDDHSLGRMNDLGMKLGAVGIASYLLTRKNTPKAKMMEFMGAGVFLSMMHLWQKIFIAAPIKARFGIDINQKYVDSMGRKKDLLLDNQYIPSLDTNEELDKLADNLNLPEDMEYRREYAKELRRKIGLQARTLNMLTVGVATPVLTALICNGIEKYTDGAIIKHSVDSAERKAENFSKFVNRKVSNPLFDKNTGSKIIKQFSKKGVENVDDNFFNTLAEAFNPVNAVEHGKITAKMSDLSPEIKKDLENLFAKTIDEKAAASDIFNLFVKNAKEEGNTLVVKTADTLSSGMVEVRVSKQNLKEALEETMQKVKEGMVSYDGESILEALKKNDKLLVDMGNEAVESDTLKTLQNQYIKNCLNNADETRTVPEIIESIKQGTESAFNEIVKNTDGSIGAKKYLKAVPYEFLDDKSNVFKDFVQTGKKKYVPAFMQKVEENYKAARKISASLSGVDDIVKSINLACGKQYSNIVDSVFNTMKPDMKELNLMRNSSEYASKYLMDSIKTIASDSEKYDAFLKKLAKAPSVSETKRAEIVQKLIKGSNDVLGNAASELDPELKTLIDMSNATTSRAKGLVADIEKWALEAFSGIDSTNNRMLLTADLERRIQDGTLKQQWETLQRTNPVDKSFEAFVDDARKIIHKATPSDFANTNYIHGNGKYYKRLNDMLFNQPLSDATTKAIKEVEGLAQSLDNTRGSLMAIGSRGWKQQSISNFALSVADYVNSSNTLVQKSWKDNKEFYTLCSDIDVKNDIIKKAFEETLTQPNSVKYQKVGKSIKDFAFESASQKYNSKIWMRIFAPVAAVLIGVTLLSQLFIGKKGKEQHLYMKKAENSGAVDGNRQ